MKNTTRTRAEALFNATQKNSAEPTGAATLDSRAPRTADAEMQHEKARPARARRVAAQRLQLANDAASPIKAGSAGAPKGSIAKRPTLRLP